MRPAAENTRSTPAVEAGAASLGKRYLTWFFHLVRFRVTVGLGLGSRVRVRFRFRVRVRVSHRRLPSAHQHSAEGWGGNTLGRESS